MIFIHTKHQQSLSKEELAGLASLNKNNDIVIQTSARGSSVVKENFKKILYIMRLFQINDNFLNLVHSNSMSIEMCKSIKPVAIGLRILYGLC